MIRRLLLVSAFALAAAPQSPAQLVPSFVEGLRVEAGVGLGAAEAGPVTEAGGSLSGRLAMTALRGPLTLTARVTATSGGESPYEQPFRILGPANLYDEFYDAGVLVGYEHRASGVTLGAAAGVARVWGSRVEAPTGECTDLVGLFETCDPADNRAFSPRVGLPLEASVGVRAFGSVRLGLVGYGNVNGESPFGGVLVALSADLR